MPYPDTTKDPTEHFKLVIEDIENQMKESSENLEGIHVDFYKTDEDIIDYFDEITINTMWYSSFYIDNTESIKNKTTLEFWGGMVDRSEETSSSIFYFPDESHQKDDILDEFLIASVDDYVSAIYKQNSDAENDFKVFLEVCSKDSEMYEIIDDMEDSEYEVSVSETDNYRDIRISSDLVASIRKLLEMVYEIFQDVDLDDLRAYAYDEGENLVYGLYNEDFKDKQYIIDDFKDYQEEYL